MALGTTSKQAGKFGVVGIFNTILDFTVLNVVSRLLGVATYGKILGLSITSVVVANTVSTTIAMIVSFFINRSWVFGAAKGGKLFVQAVKFFTVTAFGLWVLQNGVLSYLVTAPWFISFAVFIRSILFKLFDDRFFIENGAKVIGTIISLVWNFMLYKFVVFKGSEAPVTELSTSSTTGSQLEN